MGRLGASGNSGRLGSSSGGGRLGSVASDTSTIEGLTQAANQAGLGAQARSLIAPKQKLSFLQRLSKGLGAFNPAEAVLTGMEKGNIGAGLKEYGTNVVQGIGSAITGTDYEGQRRSFADVADKFGIHNAIARFGIGFAGDIFLDPSTYFGGALAKGLIKGAEKTASLSLRVVGKFAPQTEEGIRLATEGLKDAFGRAFQYGYRSSEGAAQDVLTFLSQEERAQLGLAASNLNRLGTGVLTQSQREELAINLIAGKRTEFQTRQLSSDIAQSAEWFKPVQEGIQRLLSTRVSRLQRLNKEINDLNKKGLKVALKPEVVAEPTTAVARLKTTLIPTVVKEQAPKTFDDLTNSFSVKSKLQKEFGSFENLVTESKGGGWQHLTDIGIDERTAKSIITQVRAAPVITPGQRILETIPATLGTKETRDLVSRLVFAPKQEVERIQKLVGTREAWKNDLFSEINALRADYTGLANAEQDTLKLARSVFSARGDRARAAALGNITDPVVRKKIEDQIVRSKKFAETAGLQNPYETYFPFIKKDKVERFIKESSGMRVGSEGYRKEFKNLLTNDNLELDPAKAFFTRESQIVTDKMTRDFLHGFVGKYGKPLDAFVSSDDALKEGYHLVKEKGLFGKAVGYVNQHDAALLRDSLSPEFQTVNMLAKATGFDAITSLFKRSVTGLFLPFHIRNYVSGLIQNFEELGKDAMNPKNIAIGQKIAYLMGKNAKIPGGVLKVGGKTMKFSDVMRPFVDRFSGDTFYNNDFLQAIKNGESLKVAQKIFSKGSLKETAKTAGLGTHAIPFRVGRAVGQFIEHQQKATAYITALNQGKRIKEALQIAENAGFDYRALTRFESQIMRRIIPFYSFTRKNIGLQLRTLGENPQRINQVLAFFQNLGEPISAEEKKALPDYLKESIGIKLPDTPDGLKQYISAFGTPIEQFAQLFGKNPVLRAISQTNPILKVPIELGIGKDSFRQKDLKEVYDAYEYKSAPKIVKDMLELQPIEKDILKRTLNGKLKSIGKRTVYVANPERLLIARSLFTSRGVSYLDQVFGNDMKGFVKFFKTTTGVKPTRPIDLEQIKSIKEYRVKRELEDLLTRYGVTRQYRKTFIPK